MKRRDPKEMIGKLVDEYFKLPGNSTASKTEAEQYIRAIIIASDPGSHDIGLDGIYCANRENARFAKKVLTQLYGDDNVTITETRDSSTGIICIRPTVVPELARIIDDNLMRTLHAKDLSNPDRPLAPSGTLEETLRTEHHAMIMVALACGLRMAQLKPDADGNYLAEGINAKAFYYLTSSDSAVLPSPAESYVITPQERTHIIEQASLFARIGDGIGERYIHHTLNSMHENARIKHSYPRLYEFAQRSDGVMVEKHDSKSIEIRSYSLSPGALRELIVYIGQPTREEEAGLKPCKNGMRLSGELGDRVLKWLNEYQELRHIAASNAQDFLLQHDARFADWQHTRATQPLVEPAPNPGHAARIDTARKQQERAEFASGLAPIQTLEALSSRLQNPTQPDKNRPSNQLVILSSLTPDQAAHVEALLLPLNMGKPLAPKRIIYDTKLPEMQNPTHVTHDARDTICTSIGMLSEARKEALRAWDAGNKDEAYKCREATLGLLNELALPPEALASLGKTGRSITSQ